MNIKEVPASMTYLEGVMAFIDAFLEEAGCTEDEKRYIEVSAEELFTNIASYAYGAEGGWVRICCGLAAAGDEPAVTVSFSDCGRPYNPFAGKDPDFGLSIEERPVGGLGVYMVKQFMDTAEYCYKDGCNVTTISKRLRRDSDGAVL